MEFEKRKLDSLIENPINVRRHGQAQINEFKKSIQKFGVIRPIVIDEDGVILAGNGLASALKQLGREDADVIVMKGLSDKDKKKLLLVDNKIYSLGVDDYSAIESILKELGADNDFEVPGYDAEILEDLYGIRSVEKEVENGAVGQMMSTEEFSQAMAQEEEGASEDVDAIANYTPEVPARIQEEKQNAIENRKFVICPNCGEKVWL